MLFNFKNMLRGNPVSSIYCYLLLANRRSYLLFEECDNIAEKLTADLVQYSLPT
jgi:hypothetical protein